MRPWAAAAVAIVLIGCGSEAPAPKEHGQDAHATRGQVKGYIRTVDIEGRPLANMAPIATLQPNAFDAPIATGPLTGDDGRSHLLFPADQRVCLRAWDPELRYFANNFLEVLPHTGNVTDETDIVMVRAASLAATLILRDGAPAAGRNAGLMLFHPTRGAWWPGEADADATGRVEFAPIPPGRFVVKLKLDSGEAVDLPEVSLPPAAAVDLGPILLQ